MAPAAGQRFRDMTLPMLGPTTFFVLVISIINSFQVFDLAFMLTKGGPGDATNTIVMYIYNQGFQFFQMGYAAAIAWVLFSIIFIITLLQHRLQRRWVHYELELTLPADRGHDRREQRQCRGTQRRRVR